MSELSKYVLEREDKKRAGEMSYVLSIKRYITRHTELAFRGDHYPYELSVNGKVICVECYWDGLIVAWDKSTDQTFFEAWAKNYDEGKYLINLLINHLKGNKNEIRVNNNSQINGYQSTS